MLSCLPSRKLTQGPPRGGGLVGGSEARIVGGMGWRLGMLGSGVRSHISDLSLMGVEALVTVVRS